MDNADSSDADENVIFQEIITAGIALRPFCRVDLLCLLL